MNLPLVARMLGTVAFLIGGTMLFSLPWANPLWGHRGAAAADHGFETRGFLALLASMAICGITGAVLAWFGRRAEGRLFRKEAMAVVGLSWVLATVLGAMPFWLSHTYRKPGEPMTLVDCLFESQSGFSTTGATTISQLEDPKLVPHCILFWRSSTHFLGGLGIIVLFVALLGHGSAGKALMQTEMPGPTQDNPYARMQQTAWRFAGLYCFLNLILALLLWAFPEMGLFDALCHAFGTMATGGFSTYNASVGEFDNAGIETLIVVFMILAGTNFTLLYGFFVRRSPQLFRDTEWRTYMILLVAISLLVILFGHFHDDFQRPTDSSRYGIFQVVSIMTTTGFTTHDFDGWNSFGRGILFLIMFIGGCAGSTGGGLKVIRFVLLFKILRLEIEKAYHPSVVRPLRFSGKPVEDPDLRKTIPIYFCLILVIFITSWMFVVTTEPDATWGASAEHKLIDSASAVAATLNNIGPGLGTVGATQNYGHFSWYNKLLFVWLMMIGRLEIFSILVLILPGFWRSR